MPILQTKLTTNNGVDVSTSNPLPVSATINVGDIEIGAVELKDGTTDTRAVVDATYGLAVDVKRAPVVHTIIDSGSSTVVSATAANLKAEVVGTNADNSANPTTKQSVLSGVANASAPTRTEGNVVPLRTNLAGDVAITLDGEAVVLGAGSQVIGKVGIDQTAGQNLVGMAAISPTSQIATIANAASISDTIDLAGRTLIGIRMPAAWTAASLTFQVVEDGVTTPVNFYDYTGTEVNVVASASIYIRLNPSDWLGVRSIIVRSGTSGTPVAQGAQRLITLVSKAV